MRRLSAGKRSLRGGWFGRNGVVLLAACVSLWPGAWGFTHAAVGTLIEDAEMPSLTGGTQHLLTHDAANVVIFFKPGQGNSRDVLNELAGVEKEFAGKPVHWVAIVSDRAAKADAESDAKDAGIRMPVLIDVGDALYGKLGVALEPVTAIVGQDHKLAAYQPFTRVNYAQVIRARIRHLLKEINDEELAAVLNPPAPVDGGNGAAAHRRLKLAEELFAAKNYEKALESITISIEKDPKVAAAYVLRGKIFVAQGKCPEAIKAFEEALKLAPQDASAPDGIRKCQGK